MIDAVAGGHGLAGVAELAAAAARGCVAIVVPGAGTTAVAPDAGAAQLAEVVRYVTDRIAERPVRVPPVLVAEAAISAGPVGLGAVVVLRHGGGVSPLAGEVARLAALSAATALALEHDGGPALGRGAALVRALRDDPAAADGAAPAHGAVALCARESDRRGWVVPTIAEHFPGAPSLREDGVVWALLPASAGEDAARATMTTSRRLARRLAARTTAGLSPFTARADRLHRALHQARLALELVDDGRLDAEEATTGTWRLLLAAAVTDPDDLAAMVATSIGPALDHDARLATELVPTFQAYLDHAGNMNATAAAIYAHRHTVAARLDRLRALTRLDPLCHEDRERLGVGLKARHALDALAAARAAAGSPAGRVGFPTELV
jgi:hypothetical protein